MGIRNIDILKPNDNPRDKKTIIENLPMYVNLGDFENTKAVIGRASAFRYEVTGVTVIEIKLSKEHSDLFDYLVDIADLKAVGFAGIMKKPQT